MDIRLGFTIFMILGFLLLGTTAFVFIRLVRQYTGFLKKQGKLGRNDKE